jgi:tRNA 5-methylaminomethyl-2-thiouridine biosynthesis bifunctional protein
MARLPEAPLLTWDEAGAPRAARFDDVYFSKDGGLEESRAVFLAGCGLPDAWAGRRAFSVLELGFGTGLNALATWQAWARKRPPGAVLHFVSIEAYLMARADAGRALAAYPELAPYAERLLRVWPARARGQQRLWFDGFALTVLCAPADEALAGLRGEFDAIYLDGFSPARNPDLWSFALMAQIARVSAPGARLASYSVAGPVRRALTAAGFACEKRPGFAGKRERLEARYAPAHASRAIYTLSPYAPAAGPRVAIIGAGIAGAAAAAAFVRRGVAPVIYDAAPALGAGASGSPAALLSPRLDRDDLAPARLYRAAYLEALRVYGEIGALDPIGVEERPADARDGALLADLAADPPLDADLLRQEGEGLFHPRAGLVAPARALAALAHGAAFRGGAFIAELERRDGAWRLLGPDGVIGEADIVVLCAGRGLGAFAQTRWLPLEYSRGQIDWGAAPAPAHVITSGGYVAPFEGGVLCGATFDPVGADQEVAPDDASSVRNRAALAALAPASAAAFTAKGRRAAVRVSTNDRMPVAGLAPDARAWAWAFASLRDGRAPADMSAPPPAHDGLYLLGALGARGFLLAPLLGERIAAEAFGEPQALDSGALDAAHPARFLIRALKRGQALDL